MIKDKTAVPQLQFAGAELNIHMFEWYGSKHVFSFLPLFRFEIEHEKVVIFPWIYRQTVLLSKRKQRAILHLIDSIYRDNITISQV